MTARAAAELAQLLGLYPDLDFREEGLWVRLPCHELPDGWSESRAELCFRIPESVAVQPYGFWVHPGITLVGGGTPMNYTFPVEVPFGPGWGQFSWAPAGSWRPHAEIERGDNMVHFLRSIRDRLEDLH